MNPKTILNDPFLNKGTGFSQAERDALGLNGLLPPKIQTIQQQARQAYAQYQTKSNALEKRLFLMQLFNENRTLFYNLFSQHISEFMPVVYDPTIAETIEHYSQLFIQPQDAVYLSIDHPEQMAQALKNGANGRDIRLLVVTDGEGILGIGDWGTQGVDISVGKLMVYTAATGLDPKQVLPVVIDAGTNRQSLLDDPLYLGNQHTRLYGPKYEAFIDQFVTTATDLFPDLYLHWEDFGRSNAAKILKRYQNQYTTFNDDIQGTGIIVLAALLGALKITGAPLTQQKYLCFGSGTAGAGIVQRIYDEMVLEGLSPEAAKANFYLVDKQGLLFEDTPGLTPEQKPFARKRSEFAHPDDLVDLQHVVAAVHPTVLVGTSTVPGAFTEAVVKEMAAHTPRPIIFPISNPTKLIEAKAEDLIAWTKGKALVATGIPSAPVTYNGVTYEIGQANNALVYPGLAFGTIAVKARLLSDTMISAAAHSLGGIVDPQKPGAPVLPPVSQLDMFSDTVATATAQAAVKAGLTQVKSADVPQALQALKWQPTYTEA